jgi:hypothetical protein
MTDDQFNEMMQTMQKLSSANKKSDDTIVMDKVFKGVIGLGFIAIGWMSFNLPVMQNNIEEMKLDISTLREQTQDRFTRADFNREITPYTLKVERNTDNIDDIDEALNIIAQRLIVLEEKQNE